MKKIISLADINVSDSPVVRAAYEHGVAEEYAEQYRLKKNTMPLPVLFEVGKEYLIADGLHRINGMKMAGLKQHVFEVTKGTKQECLRHALLSNVGHGIRRSNADKHHCVVMALREFQGLSHGVIAEYCAVSVAFVSGISRELTDAGTIKVVEKRTGLDGKVRSVNPSRNRVETPETKENNEKTEAQPDASAVPEVETAGDPVDETGLAIPDKARHIWENRHQIDPFIDTVEDLRSDIEAAADAKDLLFAEVNFKALIADLANIRGQLLLAKPYAVCPACSGKLPESCRLCLGKGMVSKFRYETSPIELRKMRGMK